MASPTEHHQHDRVDFFFIAALLLSVGMHAIALFVLPSFSSAPHPQSEQITVEIVAEKAKPAPSPPEEAPKPLPEPPKPKPVPKKPLPAPKPVPAPQPQTEAPPPPPSHEAEPPKSAPPAPPPVIAAPPKPAEPPSTFVAPAPPTPEPPKPRGPSEQDIENARGNYSNALAREFAKHKQYPRIAQMRGWQGTAKVELHLDASGNMTSSAISESSGFEVLDKQALEMVRKATPLPQPPDALRGREFTIIVPITFKLE